jgi:phospholipid transport system substrate-binding protein
MTLVSRRILMAAGLSAGMLPGFARAQTVAGPAAADAATQPIIAFDAALLNVMKAGGAVPFPQRFQMLAPAVDGVFDLERILRVSVGSYWESLPAAQTEKLGQVFRSFIIATYVSNFHSYSNDLIQVAPGTRTVGADQIVTSTFQKAGAEPLRIDYVMSQSRGGWKVQDILLDGTISRVAVQRSDFSNLLARGDATPLIASLTQKVSVLSDGTIVS